MRILIGYNGSDAASAALHDLRLGGFSIDTEILLLTVAEAWLRPKTEAEALSISETGKEMICSEFPMWTVTSETAKGSPPREILALSQAFKPDLIIVGEPRQMISEGHMFVGHTSKIILNESECSVRISRGLKSQKDHPEKILVGFDGSPGASRAVEAIAERKWPSGTEVRLLAVADSSVLSSIGRFTPQMNDASVEAKFASQWAETLAASSLDRLKEAGVAASVEVRFGNPKIVIAKEAEGWNADTIFVGPHSSPNSFDRFLIGSVSASVAAQAHCSVEVVRHADRHDSL